MQSLGLHCEICFLTTSRMCGAFGTMSLSLPCLFGRRRRRSLSTITLRVAKEKMKKSCLRLRHCHAGIFLAKLDHSKNGWLPMFIIRKIQRWHDILGILPWFDSRCKYLRTTLPQYHINFPVPGQLVAVATGILQICQIHWNPMREIEWLTGCKLGWSTMTRWFQVFFMFTPT